MLNFLLGIALAQATSLEVYQGSIVWRTPTAVERFPLKPTPPELRVAAAFRRDRRWAVWDERGLTTRDGDWTANTRLDAIPVSPRVFSREEILANVEAFKSGDRKREASALSGSARLGTDVFFLVRWDAKDGTPWLEALFKVDLAKERPKPEYLGRFGGLSPAKLALDSQLAVREGALRIVERRPDAWGIGEYRPATNAFSFDPLGESLEAFVSTGMTGGFFVEKTGYDTFVVGELALADSRRKTLAEMRTQPAILDAERPVIATWRQGNETILRNLTTGAETAIPRTMEVRRYGPRIVVCSPGDNPRQIRIYEPERWRVLASR